MLEIISYSNKSFIRYIEFLFITIQSQKNVYCKIILNRRINIEKIRVFFWWLPTLFSVIEVVFVVVAVVVVAVVVVVIVVVILILESISDVIVVVKSGLIEVSEDENSGSKCSLSFFKILFIQS